MHTFTLCLVEIATWCLAKTPTHKTEAKTKTLKSKTNINWQ